MCLGREGRGLEDINEKIFLPIVFLKEASSIFTLFGIALTFFFFFLSNLAERAAFRFLLRQCFPLPAAWWCWEAAVGALHSSLSPPLMREHPLQLPPWLQPSIPSLFLKIQHISILKHYATLYVCVAGKKLLSDTHWCY